MKRIMVDMSATLIHHGHIRLLKKASELGSVIIALTTDDEIQKMKGYEPELIYLERKEIFESIKYVEKVVPSPWLIDESFLNKHNIDLLVHGSDNSNPINPQRLVILPRTKGVSTHYIRSRVLQVISTITANQSLI